MSIPTYYGATGYLMVKHADHLMFVEQLRAENEELRKLAAELRDSVECHNMDHCKAEQHELGSPCKVLARIDAALAKGVTQ